jgi:hypothetical protein
MPATKIDFKRELRDLYLPGREPVLVDVPEMAFLMVDGRGDPNTATMYREAIEALFAVAYAAKFIVKRTPPALDFAVMPLETLWWSHGATTLTLEDKADWMWTAMIMQPQPVTAETVEEARHHVAKRSLPALDRLRYEPFTEGRAAHVMYMGPYEAEGPTIRALRAFIEDQGGTAAGKHHEIYLGDPRRSAPEKLRTVIRQPIAFA